MAPGEGDNNVPSCVQSLIALIFFVDAGFKGLATVDVRNQSVAFVLRPVVDYQSDMFNKLDENWYGGELEQASPTPETLSGWYGDTSRRPPARLPLCTQVMSPIFLNVF